MKNTISSELKKLIKNSKPCTLKNAEISLLTFHFLRVRQKVCSKWGNKSVVTFTQKASDRHVTTLLADFI